MISFSQYTEMHFLQKQEGPGISQIAQKMSLNRYLLQIPWSAGTKHQAHQDVSVISTSSILIFF